MKCFCHGGVEAVAACRNCGKGMCSECSAYSGHSGICPACRKVEFEREMLNNERRRKECNGEIGWAIFWGILLCWTIIGLIWNVVKIFMRVSEKKKIDERNALLAAEIDKINKVYLRHTGRAFI